MAPEGDRLGAGTRQEPWPLSRANEQLQPGDTAVLMDGSYTEQIKPSSSGTSENPICYIAQNLHKALFSGAKRVSRL